MLLANVIKFHHKSLYQNLDGKINNATSCYYQDLCGIIWPKIDKNNTNLQHKTDRFNLSFKNQRKTRK